MKALFINEADLCASFISYLPDGWTAYPETQGFDILLSREADGLQIGIEAKMTLNAKVLLQAVEGLHSTYNEGEGPDHRAALVPHGTAGADLARLALKLGVTVIECKNERLREAEIESKVARYGYTREQALKWLGHDFRPFSPDLPVMPTAYDWRNGWKDLLPTKRLDLPEYVPDVTAGASAPMQLSPWKIKAIKIFVLLERRGYVTGMDFIELEINRQYFVQNEWIASIPMDGDKRRSKYVAGKFVPDLRRSHPVNFDQIAADLANWATAGMLEGIEVSK